MIFVLASLATLVWVARRAAAGQPPLPYERRQPVPWTVVAPAVLLALAVVNLIGTVASAPDSAAHAVANYSTTPLWMAAGAFVLFAITCWALLGAVFGATETDLGFPRDARQLRRDVAAGAIGCMAAWLPVYAIQYVLMKLFEPEGLHPVLEQFAAEPTLEMALATMAVAVVGAPLFEETMFRLTLQGWLEKFATTGAPGLASSALSSDDAGASAPAAATETEIADGDAAIDAAQPQLPAVECRPSWAAILISGTLFAFSHLGQNAAPISLLPLGFVLGYLYQRTHRLAAPIACHALFNAISLLAAWASASTIDR
jgi:membrane protease YdiL (CAAX protease family)